MGRKTNKLQKAAMIKALERKLGIVSEACKSAQITRQTHYNWLAKDEKYKKEVEGIQELAIDFVESKLFKQIRANKEASTIFFLKTKGRARGYVERQDIYFPKEAEPTEFILPGGRLVAI